MKIDGKIRDGPILFLKDDSWPCGAISQDQGHARMGRALLHVGPVEFTAFVIVVAAGVAAKTRKDSV